jgi:hypothetical protein
VAGLFLSHSSVDKPFVQRLAIDLIDRDMPVWFDTWEMGAGDSLIDKVYEGIGDSDYVLVVLSPNSVGSAWVKRELTAALSLEERRGRTLVVPIRLAHSEVPLTIADRLYADFSEAYLEPFEQLVTRLRKLGLERVDEPPEHAVLPLVFEKGLYLDDVRLERRLAKLTPRLPERFSFSGDQFLVAPEDQYVELRRRLARRVERIVDDPYYSAEFSLSLRQRYRSVGDLEQRLIDGVALIVNGWWAHRDTVRYPVVDACHWYTRLVRAEILALLWSSQNPDDPDMLDYGSDGDLVPLADDRSAARFYGVDAVNWVDVGPGGPMHESAFARLTDSVMISVDAGSSSAACVKDALICSVAYAATAEFYAKYLIPQLVLHHVRSPDSPLSWTFDGWYAGTH